MTWPSGAGQGPITALIAESSVASQTLFWSICSQRAGIERQGGFMYLTAVLRSVVSYYVLGNVRNTKLSRK